MRSRNRPSKLTVQEFNGLASETRANYLWEHGVFFAERFVKQDFIVKTYSLGKFYADVWYSLHTNKIEDIFGFDTDDAVLDNIIKDIDLRKFI